MKSSHASKTKASSERDRASCNKLTKRPGSSVPLQVEARLISETGAGKTSRTPPGRESLEQRKLVSTASPRFRKRKSALVEFTPPDLKGARIVRHMHHPQPKTLREDFDAPACGNVQMPRRVELNPIGRIMPARPTIGKGNPKQQEPLAINQT